MSRTKGGANSDYSAIGKTEDTGRDYALRIGVVALLILMPLTLGAVHPLPYFLSEVTVFLMLIKLLIKTLRKGNLFLPLSLAWPFAGMILLLVLIQLLPMPSRALEIISPASASLRQMSSGLLAPSGPQPPSLYPYATYRALMKLLVFVGLVILVTNIFRTERDLKALAVVIGCTGFAVALIGLLQERAGAEGIYGLWRSRYWDAGRGNFFGTFVNKNHFAGYMGMAIPLTIGLVTRDSSRKRSKSLARRLADADSKIFQNFIVLFCASVMLYALMRSGSAGGIASLILASLAILLPRALRNVSWTTRALLLFGLIVVCVGFVLYSEEMSLFASTLVEQGRGHLWSDSIRMALAHLWIGTGLGTFKYVFPVYKTLQEDVIYRHAHNEYIEFFTEAGLIGAVCLIAVIVVFAALLAYGLRRGVRLKSAPLAVASVVGILAFLLHGCVDFNFRIPANAATFAVVVGIAMNSMHPVLGSPSRFHEIKITSSKRLPKMCCLGCIALLAVLSLLTVSAATAHVHRSIAESLIEKPGKKTVESALRYLRIATILDPLHSEHRYIRGKANETLAAREHWDRASRGRYFARAAEDYARAVQLQPTSALYHLSLGYALAGGRPESTTPTTKREFQRALRLNPSSPNISEYLAWWSRAQASAQERQGET